MTTVKEAIQIFIDTRKAGRRANTTIIWYGYMLNPFGERYNMRLRDVKTREIARWLVQTSEGKAEATASDKHRALAVFWKWAADVYNIQNPMRGIPKPNPGKLPPKAIRIETLDAILKVCGEDAIGHRNRAILLLMADTGLRASELIAVNLDDIKDRMIIVRKGKTRSSSRTSPFGKLTDAAICKWLEHHPGNTPALFCTLAREPQRLTYWGLRDMLEYLAKRAKVEDEIHNLHSLRHFAGQQYAAQGGSLGAIQRNLGHSSATTTVDFYLNHAPDERAAMHDQYSPLNRLK